MSKKLTYEYVRNYIGSFGYELISEKYLSAHKTITIKCSEGHEYNTSYAKFQSGRRCSACNKVQQIKNMSLTYDDVKNYIESFNYKLISDEYINNHLHLYVECDKGHQYKVKFFNFKQGKRCPECANEIRRKKRFLQYNDVKKYIESFGYKLLSNSYENAKYSYLSIQCNKGHVFQMTYDSFRIGHRCTVCNESKGEATIREFYEKQNIIFTPQFSFEDCRNIEPLRFDFAIFQDVEKTKLAFLCEYDGEFHYFPIESKSKLRYQQKLDNIKNKYCKQNNIPLLRIPYTEFDNIEQILHQELTKYNLID